MTTTSPNFGPLTTTFTPPSDCFTEQWLQHNVNSTLLAWGPTCNAGKIAFASSCYPSGWQRAKDNDSNLNYKAFSPGLVCPSGFTPTFSASHIKETKSFLLSAYVTSLGTNDVATVCCPSGYDFGGDLCRSNALVLSARPIITVSDSKCATKTAPDYNGVIGAHGKTGAAALEAAPVILIRNTISDPLPFSTSSSTPGSGSAGLSTGAKIAIGVCIPVAVLIAAAVVFIIWHRRRRQRVRNSGPDIPLQNTSSPSVDPFLGKPELDGSAVGGTVEKHEHEQEQELDAGYVGWKSVPAELPAEMSPTKTQAELDGGHEFGKPDGLKEGDDLRE
ncbi:hypothetical protein N7478_011058 [Penicillium angulare]|uniref:uncharacterized protein n=1 Tax=Penicillium angulare TaxID=116970 RepID=UPI0025415668|nr:uncharacterized protein N7478_011058 [Penicillium angulare]KAJ5263453.1 hypothetical protein N7478_011058 [Penicillium angulare]